MNVAASLTWSKLGLYLHFSDQFGTIRNSVRCQINKKKVRLPTQIRFGITRLRKSAIFSPCWIFYHGCDRWCMVHQRGLEKKPTSLGIMGDQFRAPLKPLNTIECCDSPRVMKGALRGFQRGWGVSKTSETSRIVMYVWSVNFFQFVGRCFVH